MPGRRGSSKGTSTAPQPKTRAPTSNWRGTVVTPKTGTERGAAAIFLDRGAGRGFLNGRIWRALSRRSARRGGRARGYRRRLQDRERLLGAENFPPPDRAPGFGGHRRCRIQACRRQVFRRHADRAVVAIREGVLEIARCRDTPRPRRGGRGRCRPRHHRIFLRAVEKGTGRRPALDPRRHHGGHGRHPRLSITVRQPLRRRCQCARPESTAGAERVHEPDSAGAAEGSEPLAQICHRQQRGGGARVAIVPGHMPDHRLGAERSNGEDRRLR